jgi:hypothetical protein
MATIRQTLKRASPALQRVETFVAAGGDLKSEAATTVGAYIPWVRLRMLPSCLDTKSLSL